MVGSEFTGSRSMQAEVECCPAQGRVSGLRAHQGIPVLCPLPHASVSPPQASHSSQGLTPSVFSPLISWEGSSGKH